MGIYPDLTYAEQNGKQTLTRTYNDFSGLTTTYVYQLVAVIEERTNCYCCSCPEVGGSDIACRNHGFAASRPCEEHGTPGQVWDDMDIWKDGVLIDGTMPESVQEVRRGRAAATEES